MLEDTSGKLISFEDKLCVWAHNIYSLVACVQLTRLHTEEQPLIEYNIVCVNVFTVILIHKCLWRLARNIYFL